MSERFTRRGPSHQHGADRRSEHGLSAGIPGGAFLVALSGREGSATAGVAVHVCSHHTHIIICACVFQSDTEAKLECWLC